MSDPTQFSEFLRQAQKKGLIALDRPGFPLFVFITKYGKVTTEPKVDDVDKLMSFARESGLVPDLQEEIFALRIHRGKLTPSSPTRYEWRQAGGEGFVSFGEWIQERGYRRRESSQRLERVVAA